MEMVLFALAMKFVPWVIVGVGVLVFVRTRDGRALVRRLRQENATAADVAALAGELDEVRREMGEVQERLDFTERLLAQQRVELPRRAGSRADTPTPPALEPAGER